MLGCFSSLQNTFPSNGFIFQALPPLAPISLMSGTLIISIQTFSNITIYTSKRSVGAPREYVRHVFWIKRILMFCLFLDTFRIQRILLFCLFLDTLRNQGILLFPCFQTLSVIKRF